MNLNKAQRSLTKNLHRSPQAAKNYHTPDVTPEALERGAKRRRIEEIAESQQQAKSICDGWD